MKILLDTTVLIDLLKGRGEGLAMVEEAVFHDLNYPLRSSVLPRYMLACVPGKRPELASF